MKDDAMKRAGLRLAACDHLQLAIQHATQALCDASKMREPVEVATATRRALAHLREADKSLSKLLSGHQRTRVNETAGKP